MTKHKILTPEAKIHSKLSKKLNNCKRCLNNALRGIERRNKQIKIDYQLLPQSHGDFRIGAENYRKKLLYDEMVDTPLEPAAQYRLCGICATTRSGSGGWRLKSTRSARRKRFSRNSKAITRRRAS